MDTLEAYWQEGLSCFLKEAFLEAHEAWERGWRSAREPERALWKGWAQLAAGCLHLQRGNPKGAYTLFTRSRARLAQAPSSYRGLDMKALLAALEGLLANLGDPDLPLAHLLSVCSQGATLGPRSAGAVYSEPA